MAPGEPTKRDDHPQLDGRDPVEDLERQFHSGGGPATAAPVGIDAEVEADVAENEKDRLLRQSALGRRLAKRRGYAVRAREPKTRTLLSSWGLGGVLLLSLWSAWGAWPQLAWWLSNGPPVELGHLGAYDLEKAQDGAFARVEGIASPKRGSYSHFGQHELFPLIASRILVDRAGEPDESARGLAFRYSGEGRLHRAEAEGKWASVREKFYSAGELAKEGDVWVLEDGVAPRKGWRTPLEFAAWTLAAAFCAGLLVVRGRARLAG
jgi:hypothetical protein